MSDDPILSALARLETGQTKLRVDLMDRMDRLQDSLTGIREDIGVNLGTAEAGQRANDNTRTELRTLGDQVQVMYRRMLKIEADIRGLKGDP